MAEETLVATNAGDHSKATAEVGKPPKVITVDTAAEPEDDKVASKEGVTIATSQARTPKHANKAKEEPLEEEKKSDDKDDGAKSFANQRPPASQGGFPPQAAGYHGNVPHVSPSAPHYYQARPAAGRYYDQPPPHFDQYRGGPQPRFGMYAGGPPPQYGAGQGPPPPPMYSSSFDNGQPSWGNHPPPPNYGRPMEYARHQQPQASNNNNSAFSRAVSSSFDRSVKSRASIEESKQQQQRHLPMDTAIATNDHSVADDASWGQLNQVTSVDEEEMRKRLSKRDTTTPTAQKEVAMDRHHSNSSSLTNSPMDGVDKKNKLDKAKLTSSLDSLSSVASAQEPMDTKNGRESPDEASLDLMKCPSGTSALLLPSHQRNLSSTSLIGKRSREEVQDEHKEAPGKTSSRSPPLKKAKAMGKKSPLSITCSPPNSPEEQQQQKEPRKPKALYAAKSHDDYDKLHYTYSIDSAPAPGRFMRRPGSSASSTMTPMNVEGEGNGEPHTPGVQQFPSWELYQQDSFGGHSHHGPGPSGGPSGGGGLLSSFSFQNEYPPLGRSHSIENRNDAHHSPRPRMPDIRPDTSGSILLESRNQSFDAGGHGPPPHFQHGFSRSDSMMSYDGSRQGGPPPPPYEGRYQGPYPPHAPSWGSNGSYHPPPNFGPPQFRASFPPGHPATMMRNYSEDRSASPPPGMRMMPPSFQPPPPEFRAPPPAMMAKGQQMITTTYMAPKNGYGWGKDEDERLSEIMKKLKNVKDWEPVAKELGTGRSAKECHERWIRYLKPGVRKGQWTDQEDAIVMEMVSNSTEQPFTRWSDLALRLPGRVGKQIRDRWVNHLNPNINHLPFSRADDLLLWDGHKKLGKRWVEISTKFFHSSRSENHIKNRWYSASFKKFISNEFGPDAYNKCKTPTKKSKKAKKDDDDDAHISTKV